MIELEHSGDWFDDPYADDEPDPEQEFEIAMQDCGFDPGIGFCWHAGTEYCGFRCPFRHEFHARLKTSND